MTTVLSVPVVNTTYAHGTEPLYVSEERILLPKGAWCGLVYLECGKAKSAYTVDTSATHIQHLYYRAVQATGLVSQGRTVHIFWMGTQVGSLRGMC